MRKMINNIASVLEGVTTAAIAGHVRPDGDCVGSCMGMYLYLKENLPTDPDRCLSGGGTGSISFYSGHRSGETGMGRERI